MANELKPCPFCGGAAELDTRQGYTYFSRGQYRHGTAVAVYCTECSVQISVCREDVPDIAPEAVIEMWNRRVVPCCECEEIGKSIATERVPCSAHAAIGAPPTCKACRERVQPTRGVQECGVDGWCMKPECRKCHPKASPASGVLASPAPNPCKLTECQGKPRCDKCVAMGLNVPDGVKEDRNP